MGNNSGVIFFIGSLIILGISLFISPIFFILFLLLIFYLAWDFWDDYNKDIAQKREDKEYPFLYDPFYQFSVE